MHNIFLIGMPGSGKSTVGKALADLFGLDFCDIDAAIVQQEKLPIADIFTKFGEKYFRECEYRAFCAALDAAVEADKNTVFALGGGAITNPQLRDILFDCGKVIWLEVSVETALARLADPNTESRPLLAGDMKTKWEKLLIERANLYANAVDFTVVTDNKTPNQIAAEIEDKCK